MEMKMTKLTPANILSTIKNDKRIDQKIDIDINDDRVMIWLESGWTWDPLDGNRTCESFNLATCDWDEPDTIAYLKNRIKNIQAYDVEAHNALHHS